MRIPAATAASSAPTHRRFRQVERLEQDVLRELQPENGCGSQHGEHVRAEGPHPAPHDLAEAGRNAVGHHHRRATLLALRRTGRPAQVHPVTDQLRGVERVSRRLVPQSPGDTAQLRIRCRTRGRDDQLGQLGLVQARQLEVTDLAPLELGERSSQLVGYLLPWIAPAHEDENRSVSQCPDELTEEEEGRRFCPLQVIENEDQRSTAGDPTQEIDGGVEREEPLGGVVRTGRRRRRRHPSRQPGAEPRQLAAEVGHMLGQEVEGCVLDARVEHRTERFKRHAGLVAAPVEHGRHGRGRHRVGELGEQRRLAHSGLTAHHDAPQAGLSHQSQLSPEHLLLGGAADERDAVCQIGRQRYRPSPRSAQTTRCQRRHHSTRSPPDVRSGRPRMRARCRTLRPAATGRSGRLVGRRPGGRQARGPGSAGPATDRGTDSARSGPRPRRWHPSARWAEISWST